jgi:hypothetical protein
MLALPLTGKARLSVVALDLVDVRFDDDIIAYLQDVDDGPVTAFLLHELAVHATLLFADSATWPS